MTPGLIVSHLPVLTQTVTSLRGGAAVLAASSLAGGAQATTTSLTPEARSVLWMALAMACHYWGYSLARPITVALFTSASTGFAGSAAALPLAMALVSPLSLGLLMGYGKVLEKRGPKGALLKSTLFCAAVVGLAAFGLVALEHCGYSDWTKFISGPLFVFRESYVQLLTSQYWSYFASVLTPNQSARWFAPIAGLTSMASALAGVTVSPLMGRVGLAGGLVGTSLMLVLSLLAARVAYDIAEQHGFAPTDHMRGDKKKKVALLKKKQQEKNESLVQKATKLFQRVPVLGALFSEILASQGLATVLNVIFVAKLSRSIPDDGKRAGYVGLFFATINVITMVLQFGVLPIVMNYIQPRDLWRVVPLISLAFTTFQACQADPTLYLVSASLLVMKVSEYSARRMLDEMVFVPLDFESRFVGKEVIGVFGHRFGKSLMSLLLSARRPSAPATSVTPDSITAFAVV